MSNYVQDFFAFHTRYNPPDDVKVKFEDASLTTQEDAELADINNIMERFALGQDVPIPDSVPFFGDFTEVPDMQSALNVMQRASEAFDDLPIDIRHRFDNDPRKLVDFVLDSRNREEAERLGLVSPSASKAPEASKAEGVNGGVTSSPPVEASPNT